MYLISYYTFKDVIAIIILPNFIIEILDQVL